MEEVTFKDLSIWLKIAIIGGWVTAITFVFGFIYGFLGL